MNKIKTPRRYTITALAACRFYAMQAGIVKRYTGRMGTKWAKISGRAGILRTRISRRKDGQFYWTLKAEPGRVLATGQAPSLEQARREAELASYGYCLTCGNPLRENEMALGFEHHWDCPEPSRVKRVSAKKLTHCPKCGKELCPDHGICYDCDDESQYYYL